MRKRGSPLIPIRGEMRLLPFDAGVMDVVLCNSTLEHISDIEPVLLEFSRVLRPGGYLLFTVPSVNFEQMLFRYRVLRRITKTTAARLAKERSAHMSHLHYLHPSAWEQKLDRALFPLVSWRSIVPDTVVALGDILSTLRDFGFGGAQQSLRRPTRAIADVPFRVKRRFCIEAEYLIARLSGSVVEREVTEGVEGAYLFSAQRSLNTLVLKVPLRSVIAEGLRPRHKTIAVDVISPYAGKYPSHS
jgi:SAM-dependent methyltransferase